MTAKTTGSMPANRPRTWDYLAAKRQRPREYDIVSLNLHWRTRDPAVPFEFHPDLPMNQWHRQYCNDSPLKHDDWNAFKDPDGLVYRTYNILQDTHESYVDGLLDEHNEIQHDFQLTSEWTEVLGLLYAPGRYLLHAQQMGSAYLVHMAPASTVSICAAFQMTDSLRWISRIAYRTAELAKSHPGQGFGENERKHWEEHPCWQGFRELSERALVAYDWGETFFALNVVAKIAMDEVFLRQLGVAAEREGDTLLRSLIDAQLVDSDRSRRWTAALVEFALQQEGNSEVLNEWAKKWVPLGVAAMYAFCEELPESDKVAATAERAARDFRVDLGLVT